MFLGFVRKKIASLSLLLAWFCANGALLDVVQVVAWGRMFSDYRETMSVGAALRATFDPAKPCELCVGVAQAKDVAEKSAPAPTGRAAEKLVLACETPARLFFISLPTEWPAALASSGPIRIEGVPVPPPRV